MAQEGLSWIKCVINVTPSWWRGTTPIERKVRATLVALDAADNLVTEARLSRKSVELEVLVSTERASDATSAKGFACLLQLRDKVREAVEAVPE